MDCSRIVGVACKGEKEVEGLAAVAGMSVLAAAYIHSAGLFRAAVDGGRTSGCLTRRSACQSRIARSLKYQCLSNQLRRGKEATWAVLITHKSSRPHSQTVSQRQVHNKLSIHLSKWRQAAGRNSEGINTSNF